MADMPLSAPDGAWNTLHANYVSLTQQLEQVQPHESDALERSIATAQDELLDTPAPTFIAVCQKLEMIWEGEMLGLDQASEERRLVLEDLERLIQAQHQLLGA